MVSDSIVNSVIKKFEKRSITGYLKYGVTLDRKDLSYEQWLTHLQEELMDAVLYIEKINDELKRISINHKRQSS